MGRQVGSWFLVLGSLVDKSLSPNSISLSFSYTLRTTFNNGWRAVTFSNGFFVAVAESGFNNRVQNSPDRINWSIQTSAADNQWSAVTAGSGSFVAVSQSGSGNRVRVSSSFPLPYDGLSEGRVRARGCIDE